MDELLQLIPEPIRDYFLIAPFFFTLLICLASGRGLVSIKKFKNDFIPLTLAVWGALWYALIAWQLNQDYRSQLWIVNASVGFVVGFASTGVHQYIERSKFLSNLPILKLLVQPEAEPKPPTTTEPTP